MENQEQNPIGVTSAGFEEKDGKYTAFENVQKHVYFVNDMSIERTKRKFIERFLRRLPIEEVEKLVGFKMEDVELEGQYTEGSKFSVELKTQAQKKQDDDDWNYYLSTTDSIE